MLAGGKALVLGVLGGRLYYLQSVEAGRYVTLAEDNRINIRLLPPPRGRILDRTGRPLAANRLEYRVVVVAEQAQDVPATLQALGEIVPIDDDTWRRVLKEVKWKRKFVPVMVLEDLTWEDVARIEVKAFDLPGISIEEGLRRDYPVTEALSHVLGYVAPIAPGDPTDDPMLQLPDFRIGKAGVEKVYDLPLRGAGGQSQVEVNAVGRIIRELDRKEGKPGADLELSIDLDLQQLAYDRFGDESGAAVLMDVLTGEILAMVSAPGFDPNAFSRGLTPDEWRTLITNPRGPLGNKAVVGQYAPGSTFKVAVALAGLEKGVITPGSAVGCPGATRLGSAVFHCWRRGGHGTLRLRDGISQSCDCYFYEVARRTGVDAIADMGRRLGLGRPVGIDLPTERPGLLPSREWKQAAMGSSWQMGETLITGIGQGYVLSTPLQLAVMTARIANGIDAVVPRLVRDKGLWQGVRPPSPVATQRLDIDADHLRVVRDGMIGVVNGPRGTARAAAIRERGREMAGKTGTSQVRRISRAERAGGVRRNEDLPWEQRDHALFIGYAPIDAPRLAVAVIVEHGGGGSKVAAPIARDILIAAQAKLATGVAAAAGGSDGAPPAPIGSTRLTGRAG
jgi:penicillin-binding protein 2